MLLLDKLNNLSFWSTNTKKVTLFLFVINIQCRIVELNKNIYHILDKHPRIGLYERLVFI